MRRPILMRAAALVAAGFLAANTAAAQDVPPTDTGKPPPERAPLPAKPGPQTDRPPAPEQNLPVIKPPDQLDRQMVKTPPDTGPNSMPIVKPSPIRGMRPCRNRAAVISRPVG